MPIFRLTRDLIFPPPHMAEDGLLAVGGDLSRERLLLAYRNGIFPWYSEGDPILWWSPDPRMVLQPEQLHVSRRLRRTLRSGAFHFTSDTAFAEVIRACAGVPRPGQDGTWLTPEMIAAYEDLRDAGYAHSIEAWREGDLAGGLYGVSIGGCFFGESMFAREKDASKAALAAACVHFVHWGIEAVDCQVATPHLERLGARDMPRCDFLMQLARAMRQPTRRGRWVLDEDLLRQAWASPAEK